MTAHPRYRIGCCIAVAAPLLLCLACNDGKAKWPWTKEEKPAPKPVSVAPVSQSAEGTIRAFGYVEGMRKLRVRGFGIVGGLANTGGGDCPDEIRKYLEAEIRRRNNVNNLDVNPKDILDNPTYAAVVVTGDIPAAAVKGERFDLLARSLGSQATSLEGGRLYFCDLKLFQPTPRGVIEGRAIAEAAGPVYVSPFGQEEAAASKSDPRFGRVLGGGRLKEDRRIQFILNSPSYGIAARLRDRINGRFGASKSVADAVSPSRIRITVPEEYRSRTRLFIDLLLHTPVASEPVALQRRAAALAEEIVHPLSEYEDIAMTWEAIGRSVVPTINRLYNHRSEAAAYYAARTGLRLGDDLALDVVVRHARTPRSPFREAAVRELGLAVRNNRAGEELRRLLDDADNRIRILAHEGLVQRGDRAIESRRVWDDGFVLDVVDCSGPPLIYVRQSEQQRIALFTRGLTLMSPAMYGYRYDHDHDLVTISTRKGDRDVWVVRRNPIHNRVSDPIRAPADLAKLLEFLGGPPKPISGGMEGMGLSYSVIVDFLNDQTKVSTIPATLVMERPLLADSAGRTLSRERPESEF